MKPSTKTTWVVVALIAILTAIAFAIVGAMETRRKAAQAKEVVDFLLLQTNATIAYTGRNRDAAKQALENSLAITEKLTPDFRRETEQLFNQQTGWSEFEWGLQWLLVASIYEHEGKISEMDAALDKATFHMHEYRLRYLRKNHPTSDQTEEPLSRDKLKAFLQQYEKANPPRWKSETPQGK
jgi:type II secretory pathway pseudopilin PulG